MSDPVLDDELIGVLRRLPTHAGDRLREERVKKRCRERLAARAHRRTVAVCILEHAIALIRNGITHSRMSRKVALTTRNS